MREELDILVVEDDEVFMEDLRRRLGRLERVSADCVFCETLSEGRAALEQQIFDVGLFDYSLPDGDALLLVEELGGRFGRTIAPVIITSMKDAESRSEILAAGAEDYLVKGEFNDATLERTILYARARKRGQHIRERFERVDRLMQLGEFAADVAHQINNPITVISNNLQFQKQLYRGMKDDLEVGEAPTRSDLGSLLEQMRTLLDESSEALARITSLVSEVQFLRGPSVQDVSPCDPNELVRKGVARATDDNDDVDVRLELVDVPMIGAEAERLIRAIEAAVQNAAEAASRDAGPPWVRVSTRPERQGVRIDVEDNGPGMSEENTREYFRPFYTTKPPSVGRGLGLPLIMQVVSVHGGTLDVESSDEGTTLTIWLPRDPAGLGDTPIETLYDDTDIEVDTS
jgi:signal transduction histidine kinase